MGSDELQILDYLKQYPGTFVSAVEICKRAGGRRRFAQDRDWARPVLRRLEGDGHLESNEFAQFRLKGDSKKAQSSRAQHIERCCKAVSSHILALGAESDDKPFATLLKEAISVEYASDTRLFDKNQSK